MLFVYIYLFPFLEKLRTNIFLNFETMIEKFEKMFLRTSSNSVDKKGMGDERYERGIKCLTDKFDNRIGRVTRISAVVEEYARIDPNMDSISPRIEPDGSNSAYFFGPRSNERRGKGELLPFSSLFNHDKCTYRV